MENNDCTNNPTGEKYYVVEMVNNFTISNYLLKKRHQYIYVRTEFRECEERFQVNYIGCDHHIIYIPEEDLEIPVPEHLGILTDEIKSEIAQDITRYLEQKYSDGINDRWKFYLEHFPIPAPTHGPDYVYGGRYDKLVKGEDT